MSLAAVLDAVADRLTDGLGAGTSVSDTAPTAAADLPAVTLTLDDVTENVAGIGRIPRGTRTGALPVSIEVDLANPVLDLGGGDTMDLLSADRRTLVLPHGPLVRADGVAEQPFAGADLQVDDGTPYAVVAAPPTGRQVRPDIDAGTLVFGQALPATGTLTVAFHIGAWDTVVSRYQGRLGVTVTAAAGALGALTRDVAGVLGERAPGVRLAPRSWGVARPGQPGELPSQNARVQQLTYHFDAELEQPLLSSGGGVITRVSVRAVTDSTAETFDIVRK